MVVTIHNPVEWHARKRALFVETAQQFAAELTISIEDEEFDGKSMLSLMRFVAPIGAEFRIHAAGHDAAEALEALRELVEQRFGGLPLSA